MNTCDTIFALSSGHGKAGVAVVRISGDNLAPLAARITGRAEITARRAHFANVRDNAGDLIDQALVIYFAAPHSFTGTDVIEIQCHGADAVVEKIFEYLSQNGARMAQPGEFSRRAFDNNKMDLADVDGLAALLDARTDMQRRQALRSMTGGDSAIYNTWRAQMIEIAAFAAAILDYDADDLPTDIAQILRVRTKKLYDEVSSALSHAAAVRAVRGGFNIVLAGRPNVGKSSLFNRIVGANRAIVSAVAGTTRDVVSADVDIDGYLVHLMDTAGLRDETSDAIEQIGIEKTRDEMANADLILRIYDNIDAPDKIIKTENEIVVINKSDMITKQTQNAICISAKTGDGMDALMHEIREKIKKQTNGMETGVAINARTKTLISDAQRALGAALECDDNWDIFSENVRIAADNIGRVLGTINANDIMDATFGQLCLGK